MAAPTFRPIDPIDQPRGYASPEHVPGPWMPTRPGEIDGFQPSGPRLGDPGPDQGYALRLAARLRSKVVVQAGEHIDDVIRGCVVVALRRASLFGRAPIAHDLNIAFTIWGFYDAEPPADLLALRAGMFEGLRHVGAHYMESRAVADLVPEATLRMSPDEVDSSYPQRWTELLGR